jgi:signal peptidase II
VRDNGLVSFSDGAPSRPPADVLAAPEPETPSRRRRAPRAKLALFMIVASAALVLDIVSKSLVAANLGSRAPVRVLWGAVYLDETRNSGAAFSVGTGATVVLTIVAVAVVAIILRTARRLRSTGWAVSLGLVLGGALGNLVDRVFRAPGVGRGHVVDWISLFGPDGAHWPIFNLADSAIVCGAILAAILALCGMDLDGRGAGSDDRAADERSVANRASGDDA